MDDTKQIEAGSFAAAVEAVQRRGGVCATRQGDKVALVINVQSVAPAKTWGLDVGQVELTLSDAHHLLFQLMWTLGGDTLHERITAALEVLRDAHEPGESYGMALAAVDRAFGRAGEPIPNRPTPKEPKS